MIDLSTWLLFLSIALATTFSPGPEVLLAISNTLILGWRRALPGAAGNALGTLIVGAISVSALGVLLRTSACAFAMLKLGGAAYLAWLGARQLCHARVGLSALPMAASQGLACHVFGRCLLVALGNPKSILFFMALFPHFMESGSAGKFAVLNLTFSACAVLSHVVYIGLAGAIARGVGAGSLRTVTGLGGLLMLGMGLSMLALELD